MTRALLLLLIAANLICFIWLQGWLGAPQQSEPERLAQQLHPEAMRLGPPLPDAPAAALPAAATMRAPQAIVVQQSSDMPEEAEAPEPLAAAPEASDAVAAIPIIRLTPDAATDDGAETATEAPPPPATPAPKEATPTAAAAPKPPPPPPSPTVCLQAGGFNERQIETLRRRAGAALPAGSWKAIPTSPPGQQLWMVYLKQPSDTAAARLRAQLRAQGIDVDRPGAALEPGISLGRYSSEERARIGMRELVARGVGGTRIVPVSIGQDTRTWALRLPRATPQLRQRAQQALGNALGGRSFQECPPNQ